VTKANVSLADCLGATSCLLVCQRALLGLPVNSGDGYRYVQAPSRSIRTLPRQRPYIDPIRQPSAASPTVRFAGTTRNSRPAIGGHAQFTSAPQLVWLWCGSKRFKPSIECSGSNSVVPGHLLYRATSGVPASLDHCSRRSPSKTHCWSLLPDFEQRSSRYSAE
jgi:hypothetical protein